MLGNIMESHPPHGACPTGLPIPSPGNSNNLLIAMHFRSPSFSSPTLPFLELLCSEPQGKDMNWLGFHQAIVLKWQELSPIGGHWGSWSLEVGLLQSEDNNNPWWISQVSLILKILADQAKNVGSCSFGAAAEGSLARKKCWPSHGGPF